MLQQKTIGRTLLYFITVKRGKHWSDTTLYCYGTAAKPLDGIVMLGYKTIGLTALSIFLK